MSNLVEDFMVDIITKNPGEVEFHQAVREAAESILPFIEANPHYKHAKILERIAEPDRIITFRVAWIDDQGEVQINRGYRIQMNNAIGPYKGGLRFHPSVNLSILKFLAFEQVLKNSLTTLPMGGGKGGSDFDPHAKSDHEVMSFCQSFMTELAKYIGADTDIPAGDIGVGGREIGYLFGQYKRLKTEFRGVLTGKSLDWGGSLMRPEATGYGQVYFAEEMLKTRGENIKGKIVTISGSGNVAQYAAEKATQMGGKVVTLSDSNGFIYDPTGIDHDKLEYVKWLKNYERGRISEYAQKYKCEYFEGKSSPWEIPCQIALPSATQNEITEEDAKLLVKNGCICVSEGANMPSTIEAINVFLKSKILFGPGKAANAGGVATSGLEMSQNSMRLSWTKEEVDARLHTIMKDIHQKCIEYGRESDGFVNYVKGANISGFIKVANAMISQGIM